MSLIKTDYDLSGGTFSVEVASPNNWRVQAIPSGCPADQILVMSFDIKGDNGDFVPLLDGNDNALKRNVHGNAGTSMNAFLVNAPTGRVKITVPIGSIGLISLDSINA